MRILNTVKLDFDDVLLRPKRSDVGSRKDVCLERTFHFLNAKRNLQVLPITIANLDTTGTMAMANAMADSNALCCLHKFYTEEQLVNYYKVGSNSGVYTLGASPEELDKAIRVFIGAKTEPLFLALDVANGYTEYFRKALFKLRFAFKNAIIIAGNVATPEMVESFLLDGTVDIVKIGIGPGGLCRTRKVTGVGYPQLSAIIECADAAHGLKGHIMADGGCREPGDVAKALAAGADFVMLGSMFAGTNECEGEWVNDLSIKNDKLKMITRELTYNEKERIYVNALKAHGMSSEAAMKKHYGEKPSYRASEGVEHKVFPYKGPAQDILDEILGGLRSACTYVGAASLKELSKRATFVRIR
jgi:GMP reductase